MLRLTNKKMTKANVWTDTLAFVFLGGLRLVRFLHLVFLGRAAHAGALQGFYTRI